MIIKKLGQVSHELFIIFRQVACFDQCALVASADHIAVGATKTHWAGVLAGDVHDEVTDVPVASLC